MVLKILPYEDMEAVCGITPAMAVKETFRMGVRDELRKMSKEAYKPYGRNRYFIESLYGTVKQSIGSNFRVKLEDIAMKMALCTILLYNLYIAVVFGVIERNLFVTYILPRLFRLSPITWNKKRGY
ncbi:MAG: hypothetical protein QXX12_02595 [Nanopusillaceae archaeon]